MGTGRVVIASSGDSDRGSKKALVEETARPAAVRRDDNCILSGLWCKCEEQLLQEYDDATK